MSAKFFIYVYETNISPFHECNLMNDKYYRIGLLDDLVVRFYRKVHEKDRNHT